MRPTWTSPGRVDGPAWPCTGRGLPGRRVTATPVRSYRTISPLPVRDSAAVAPSAVSFLWHFPAGFPGWALPTALPCGDRTFLEGFSLPPRSLGPPFDGSSAAACGQVHGGYGGGHANGGCHWRRQRTRPRDRGRADRARLP